MRQIVLDTETTGLEPMLGHRIIEIGCVELVDRRITRRSFHRYLQPDREIDAGAVDVHGITNEFLADKPRFSEVAEELMAFIDGAELIIHNAPFDIGFLNHELRLIEARWADVCLYCGVLDTLALARQLHPGQKNTLDALCRRYRIDNSQRQLHGALLDAEILTDVYLAMTGGQVALALDSAPDPVLLQATPARALTGDRPRLPVIRADARELEAHDLRLAAIDKMSGGACLWKRLES